MFPIGLINASPLRTTAVLSDPVNVPVEGTRPEAVPQVNSK